MAYSELYYHLVWTTKFREPLIMPDFEATLHGYVKLKAIQLGGIVYAIGGIEDHIHVALSIPPLISISKYVGQIKAVSAYRINRSGFLDSQFQWQTGYAIFTFRESGLSTVTRYIKNQKLHHSKGTIKPALEKFDKDK